jgi:hypothetical protein
VRVVAQPYPQKLPFRELARRLGFHERGTRRLGFRERGTRRLGFRERGTRRIAFRAFRELVVRLIASIPHLDAASDEIKKKSAQVKNKMVK